MKQRVSLTLGQVFVLTIAGLALLLSLLFYRLLQDTRRSIVDSSEPLRKATSDHIAGRVEDYLGQAETSIRNIERYIQYGLCHAEEALSVESHLFSEVLNNPDLAEVTLTHAVRLGFDGELQSKLTPEGRWQVSVFRETPDPESAILTRFTYKEGSRFVWDRRLRPRDSGLYAAPIERQVAGVADPTEHLTFKTTASSANYESSGIWSDLSYAEQDAERPESQRRVVVTVMKVVKDRDGRFVGVVRVGLREERIDDMVREEERKNSPHRIFLCDNDGRLITPALRGDVLHEEPDESLRIASEKPPPEIALALGHPALKTIQADHLVESGSFTLDRRRYLVSFKGLPKTQGWRVGIVVPEDELPGIGALIRTRNRLLWSSLGVIAAILAGGAVTLRAVQGGLAKIVAITARMRSFDFMPSTIRSPFRDVQAVMESLELAKTALRSMGKYVPIDLVRLLYQAGREPVLGGELADVSLMFTDIKDFTTLSERLSPNELAQVLGRYLEVMTGAIHGAQGTIDKYIGDAVMAVWNVPTLCPGHARRACQAALDCIAALEALFRSAEWGGRPTLYTRFGLHRDEVMVGHFGAPDRMSFTCLGDGVNLASRLEGLNKQYGTTILASETIQEEAKGAFAFRLLDVVAVKGKTKGVRVFELLGPAGGTGPRIDAALRYEQAFEAYLGRGFAQALAVAEAQPDDPPSRVLAERCRLMVAQPPPPDWDGIYVAKSK